MKNAGKERTPHRISTPWQHKHLDQIAYDGQTFLSRQNPIVCLLKRPSYIKSKPSISDEIDDKPATEYGHDSSFAGCPVTTDMPRPTRIIDQAETISIEEEETIPAGLCREEERSEVCRIHRVDGKVLGAGLNSSAILAVKDWIIAGSIENTTTAKTA